MVRRAPLNPSTNMTTEDGSNSVAKKPAKDSIVAVGRRNKELEKRAFRATSSVTALAAALVMSIIGNIYLGTNKPQPQYFAQDNASRTLTPIVPLTQPISSRAAILQHATDAIGALNNVDFLNFKPQLMDASKFFTKNAWERYVAELGNSGTIELIQRRNLVMTGVVTEPPMIVGEGTIFDSLYWDLQVPYRVRYVSQGYNESVDYIAKIKVVRVRTTDNPKGIAIAQFVAQRGSPSQAQANR